MARKNLFCLAFVLQFAFVLLGPGCAAAQVRRPEAMIGHEVGADYKVSRYETIREYFEHVADNCRRVNVRDIGVTTEGRDMFIAEVTDDASPARMDKAMADQRQIADPRLIKNQQEENDLVANAKVVVLVNCNLHSTEIASSQMAMELLYDLATGTSPEIQEILKRTIIVLIPSANPDGLDKVIDWYERSLSKPWEGAGMPWLYQTYAGHDNNRDWFMLNLTETRLVTRVIYEQWLPNILYDIHQMGNSGARLFVPPFFDPKNPNVHPLNDHMMMIIGGHMGAALNRAGKKGILNSAMYDNWWQGGFRTAAYRHNITGILTEAASVLIASPVFQRKSELSGNRRGMPSYAIATNFPDPWPGGWWRLRDIVEYEKIACMSLFTLTARYHDLIKSNTIKQARDAIELGRDEPPFAWLVPPDQIDAKTAAEMLSILHATGVEIHAAEAEFTADGVRYPAGTYILYCAQPYRAHLNDMMERQVYPNRSSYPGGPPEAPYDTAGWTLPLQMGVRSVSVNQPFECRARKLETVPLPQGKVTEESDETRAYVVRAGANDNYRLVNRSFKAAIALRIITSESLWKDITGTEIPRGSLLISDANQEAPKLLEGISIELIGVPQEDSHLKDAIADISPPRLGLYQPWTASIDEGWTRLVLDNFEFAYTCVHNAEIRAGNLRQRYDCLVLPSVSSSSIINGRSVDTTEPQYVGGIGSDGIVTLQNFVQGGGTLVCIDRSCNLPIEHFNIPVRNVLGGKSSKEFFCPGSILRVWVDQNHPVGYGCPEWISGYFARSQAFELIQETKKDDKNSRSPDVRFPAHVVARYSDTVLLESGWIRGVELIADKPAIVEVQYGDGKIILLGFAVQHRGQPHGTFRLLFNSILSSTMGEGAGGAG
ncbi:MAG: peptidase M14 [Phycisphaerae bacterium]|nr:peptidase M14 [Phycisphaerae bacterium]